MVIHDCWASYLSYDHCGHGLCGSHLLRELTSIVDANGYAWAKNLKRLLQETCHRVAEREENALAEDEYKNLQKRYRNILTRGDKELPPIPIPWWQSSWRFLAARLPMGASSYRE